MNQMSSNAPSTKGPELVEGKDARRLVSAAVEFRKVVSEVYGLEDDDRCLPLCAVTCLHIFNEAYAPELSPPMRKMFRKVIKMLLDPPA